MKIVECRGNSRIIGRTIGEALRDDIAAHIAGFLPGDLAPLRRKIAFFKKSLQAYLPDVLVQLENIAPAAGTSLDSILALNLPAGMPDTQHEQGCSNIVFSSGPDGPLWGKNNDGTFPENTGTVLNARGRRPVCVLRLYPDSGIPALCFTFCGWLSGGDMINAEGVATGHSSVGSRFEQNPDDVSVLHWLYDGMFRISSVSDYTRRVTSRRLLGKGFSQIAVDRDGNMASGELACPVARIRRPGRDAAGMCCVNHYQLPELEGMDRRPERQLANSRARAIFLDRAISDGDHSIDHMRRILRHHGDPSICRHGRHEDSYTEYSMIGIPAERKALLATGNPCENDYMEISI